MKKIVFDLMEKFGFPVKGIGLQYIKNTSFVTLAKVFESISSYIIIILISQQLGAEGLGQYSFLFSFSGLFFIIADMGITGVMIKELSRKHKQENHYLSNVYKVKVLLSLAIFLIYTIITIIIQKEELLFALLIIGLWQISFTIFGVPQAILRVKEEGKKVAFTSLLERLLALIGSVIILPITHNINHFALVLLCAQVIRFIIAHKYGKKFFSFTKGIDWTFIKKIIRKGVPFILIGVFATIYIQMDTVILSFMKGDEVVGWYQSGYKLIHIINIIPALLLTFGFPLFSKLIKTDKKAAKQFLQKILQASVIIMGPIMVGVFLVGHRILEFIYGFGSTEAFISFKILIIAELFIFLSDIMASFIAAKKQSIFAYIGAVGALVNIILNFILIPKWSLYGAGIATGITYFLMFIIMYIYINKKILKFDFWKYWMIPILSSITLYYFLQTILQKHLIIIVITGGIFYILFLGILFFLSSKVKSLKQRFF